MRIVIPGGSGLIGRALCEELAAPGNDVVVLSRRPETVRGLPAGARAERWDGRSTEGWQNLADGADAIVNLAGENIGAGRWTATRKMRIRQSRLDACRAVVEACENAARPPGVLVQASAVGYYGPRGAEPVAEEAPPGEGFLADVCRDWEAATVRVEELGVRRALARTGIVLSTQGGALPRMLLPFRLFAGGALGSGRQGFPWIHGVDEARALRFLVETDGARGAFNLTAPDPPDNRTFCRALGRALGRPSWLPVPAFALRLLLGEMSTLLLDGQRAVPRRLVQAGFEFRFVAAEAALRHLLR
jgi:uncharacterized protein (TIGR01777 family)